MKHDDATKNKISDTLKEGYALGIYKAKGGNFGDINNIKNAWKLKREKRIRSDVPFNELHKKEKRLKINLEQNYKCILCGTNETWNNKPLIFELDHIDGNTQNNSRENLRLICPNCHSQTDTYKNKGGVNTKYDDKEIIDALQKSDSIYNALKSLNLNLHGGNYTRVRKIIKTYNLQLPYLMI